MLTHEIMNSITPVTSLAGTAVGLIDEIRARSGDRDTDFADLHDAVATIARRSDSLMQFVESYRQITRLSPPEKKRILLSELFDAVRLLAEAEWPPCASTLALRIEPEGLDVYADRDLLEPVLLNLLRNAWQATEDCAEPHIVLRGYLNPRGNINIEVADNGPGVPQEIMRKIFVPFFTTKKKGSGVGLALARQVMTAHGGFVRVENDDSGGARFTLTF